MHFEPLIVANFVALIIFLSCCAKEKVNMRLKQLEGSRTLWDDMKCCVQ